MPSLLAKLGNLVHRLKRARGALIKRYGMTALDMAFAALAADSLQGVRGGEAAGSLNPAVLALVLGTVPRGMALTQYFRPSSPAFEEKPNQAIFGASLMTEENAASALDLTLMPVALGKHDPHRTGKGRTGKTGKGEPAG
ncbi:MAG: hypothetical protein ACRELG_05060 [Gemmataceae bacterium]